MLFRYKSSFCDILTLLFISVSNKKSIFVTMSNGKYIVRYIGMAMVSLLLLVVMGLSMTGLQFVNHVCCHGSHSDVAMCGIDGFSMCMDQDIDDCHCKDNNCPYAENEEHSEVVKLDVNTLIEDIVKCAPLFVDVVSNNEVCLICLDICNPKLNILPLTPLYVNPDDWQSLSGVFII